MIFKNIALIGKYQTSALATLLIDLARHLQNLGASVYIDANSSDYHDLVGVNFGQLASFVDVLDLVVVIGGDGTLLSAARGLVNHEIPVIGINQGKLGFMTDIAANDMLNAIDDVVIKGRYTLEKRSLINAQVIRKNQSLMQEVALNDVVISRGAIGNMIEFNISIDDQFVLSQKSDGVIFATPTGSTAYSLAAGGPILHPEASVFSIVPICPQSMTNRPLVVHDNAKIEFDLVRENATQIHFDGQECFDLEFGDKVLLSKHPKEFKIIHPLSYNYFNTLRTKLDWAKRVS